VYRVDSTRVDKWLWAIRAFKTRSIATDACQAGHVEVNGVDAKPATKVKPTDEVTVRQSGRTRVFEVVRVIDKRVGAPVAATCYLDRSPPPPDPGFVAPAAIRDRGAGRPTKRDRRATERYRGR
jgi:ribosome-associated heat shock protein Hsp15